MDLNFTSFPACSKSTNAQERQSRGTVVCPPLLPFALLLTTASHPPRSALRRSLCTAAQAVMRGWICSLDLTRMFPRQLEGPAGVFC